MKDLIIIKLGGSVITDKTMPFTPRTDAIRRLAAEIHEAREEKGFSLVVGHGGGSFPHQPAKEYRVNEGVIGKESYAGIAKVQDAASRLNRMVVGELVCAGENAVSVQPSSSFIARNGRITEWRTDVIEKMLGMGLVPVPYGDVALDHEKGCCIISTEEIIGFLARRLRPEKIIVAGEVGGVYTADPFKDKDAKLIPRITGSNFNEIRGSLGGSRGADVTGGMLGKVEQLLELAGHGHRSQIIDATKPGMLKQALLGNEVPGTIIG